MINGPVSCQTFPELVLQVVELRLIRSERDIIVYGKNNIPMLPPWTSKEIWKTAKMKYLTQGYPSPVTFMVARSQTPRSSSFCLQIQGWNKHTQPTATDHPYSDVSTVGRCIFSYTLTAAGTGISHPRAGIGSTFARSAQMRPILHGALGLDVTVQAVDNLVTAEDSEIVLKALQHAWATSLLSWMSGQSHHDQPQTEGYYFTPIFIPSSLEGLTLPRADIAPPSTLHKVLMAMQPFIVTFPPGTINPRLLSAHMPAGYDFGEDLEFSQWHTADTMPENESTSSRPTALYSTPTLTNPMSYGKGISGGCATAFSIFHPTIKIPLDELLGDEYKDNQIADTPSEDTKEDGNDQGDIDIHYN
ncbi:uncharacterized protein EDB91DRAFT_1086778 [Suillus paluster]|uniref:uncharacterized protein n=1 Tax=Suillus paluster TaxID=48578 RepID=UPI001B87A9BF|nr:uncharacterized protein EDB91DRAFT_1086778 [Suillus paluster]KAG1726421.1 hypothetical protein EDB91DRAFT_1086778 [Suillus paluster]